jgi:hypothetical protein
MKSLSSKRGGTEAFRSLPLTLTAMSIVLIGFL